MPIAPQLAALLDSPQAADRKRGILTILRERPTEGLELLDRIASSDPEANLRYLARKALTYLDIGDASLVPSTQPTAEVIAAVRKPPRPPETESALVMARLQTAADEDARLLALEYFATKGVPDDLPGLSRVVEDPSGRVRSALPAVLHAAAGVAGLPYVLYLMQDPDSGVKAQTRKALSRYNKRDVYTTLTVMVSAQDLWKRDTAAYVLAHLSDDQTLPLLEKCLNDASSPVRLKARRGVERFAGRNDPRAIALLAQLDKVQAAPELHDASDSDRAPIDVEPIPPLADPNPRRRLAALEDAIRSGEPEQLAAVQGRLQLEENLYVLSKLIITCGHLGNAETPARLLPYLEHDDERVVASVIEALEMLGYTRARPRLKPFLSHKCPRIRGNALLYFRDDPDVPLKAHLEKMLTGKEFSYKLTALHVLAVLGPGPLWQMVELVLGDINDDVRETAFSLLTSWSLNGHTGARDMLEMCLAGDVAIKTESLRLRRASPVRRILAFAADVIVFGLLAIMVVALAMNVGAAAAKLVGGVGLAAVIGLFFIRDSFKDGRGIGKSGLGLRVVDLSTNRGCTRAQSLIRQAALGLGIMGPVELVWLHIDPAGRRITDHLVNTRVIDEKERPLSGLEYMGAAFIYLVLASTTLGMLVPALASIAPAGDKVVSGPGGKIELTMPAGWNVTAQLPDAVVVVRRSYYWGDEVEFRLTVTSAADLTTDSKTHSLKPGDLVDIGRQIRNAAADTLRKSTPGLVVSMGKENQDRNVAGQRAFGFDLNYTLSGRAGILRGVCFTRTQQFYYMQFQSFDQNRLEARMPEINRILASTRIP